MVCRVILLALLTVCVASAVDVSGHSGSRCLCRTVKEGLPVRRITKVEIIPRSSSCDIIEIIATLKNGIQVCLNPEAPRVQKSPRPADGKKQLQTKSNYLKVFTEIPMKIQRKRHLDYSTATFI